MTSDEYSSEPAVSNDSQTDRDEDENSGRDREQCPECGATVTATHETTTERVCKRCDLVLDDAPFSYQRKRVFDNTDWQSKRQTGSRKTPLRVDRGLGTGVGQGNRDANGNTLSTSQRNRIRKGHWGKAVDAGNLRYALGELQRVASAVGIPEPEQEAAARLYRRASREDLVQGRTIEGFVCACLLVAARDSKTTLPVTSEMLLGVSRVDDKKKITNARTALVREFEDVKIVPASPKDYVVKIANDVGASNEVLRHVRDLLDTYRQREGKYNGANPRVTAAVALHAAFDLLEVDDRPTLDQLGHAADVNATTISKRKSAFVEAVA